MSTPQAAHDNLALMLKEAGLRALVNTDEGKRFLNAGWPHRIVTRSKRTISDAQKLAVFIADGFRCRYTGDLLLFSGYLTALSHLWPDTFPAHPHGKSDEAHEAYWTHFASVEHLDPISIGGQETEANWITTSMARNQVRSRYSLEALGWSVRPREPKQDWDGGVRIFLNLMDRYPELSTGTWGPYLSRWRKIAAAQI